MKKIIAVLVAAMMCMTMFTACGSGIKIPDEYNYDDLSKYIDLGEYKGIKYEAEDITVTTHQVEARLDQALDEAKTQKKMTSGTVTEDCTANIDYVGSMNGVEFEGGAGEAYDLDIDNSSFIPGFAEALIGHSVGETFDIDVTFPEEYGSADLAGKPAVFKITVNYITKDIRPEYNDEFVKNNTEYSTTEEFEKSIRAELTAEMKKEAAANERSKVIDKIVNNSKVLEYPEKELNAKKSRLLESAGQDSDTSPETIEENAKFTVKMELVLHQIARLEGIEFTDADYNDYVNKLLSDAGMTPESFKEQNGYSIEEFSEKSDLFTSFLYQRVMDKVMEYSKVK